MLFDIKCGEEVQRSVVQLVTDDDLTAGTGIRHDGALLKVAGDVKQVVDRFERRLTVDVGGDGGGHFVTHVKLECRRLRRVGEPKRDEEPRLCPVIHGPKETVGEVLRRHDEMRCRT